MTVGCKTMHTIMATVAAAADLIATATEIGIVTTSQRHGIIIRATIKVKSKLYQWNNFIFISR